MVRWNASPIVGVGGNHVQRTHPDFRSDQRRRGSVGAIDRPHRRRAEIIRAYERDVYGRIPAVTPRVTWVVTEDHGPKKLVVGTVGTGDRAVRMNLTLNLPPNARGPVPVILMIQFGGGGMPVADPPEPAEFFNRGWGYAKIGYNDIQPDRANTFDRGIIGLTSDTPPGPDASTDRSSWRLGRWASSCSSSSSPATSCACTSVCTARGTSSVA